jgi:hypothetical protein
MIGTVAGYRRSGTPPRSWRFGVGQAPVYFTPDVASGAPCPPCVIRPRCTGYQRHRGLGASYEAQAAGIRAWWVPGDIRGADYGELAYQTVALIGGASQNVVASGASCPPCVFQDPGVYTASTPHRSRGAPLGHDSSARRATEAQFMVESAVAGCRVGDGSGRGRCTIGRHQRCRLRGVGLPDCSPDRRCVPERR